jgi:penicillin-binding protein 1A
MTLEDYFDPSWHRPLHAGQKTRGLVEKVSAEEVEVRVHRERFTLTHESMPWVAKSSGLDQLFQVGDVPLFEVLETAIDTEEEGTLVPNVSRTLLLDQEPTLQGGLYALNTKTGAIVAMVGGYDYRDNKFNMAEQALRQVGSAFKPFLYGAAFEHGYTLADLFLDEPTTFYDPTYFELREGEPVRKPLSDWVEREILLGRRSAPQLYTPRNYHERNFNGLMTMRKALAQSKNIIAVKLLNELGYDKVFAYLDQLSLLHPSFQPFPSMALGSFEMTLADLTHAYSAYATNGIRFEPLFVQKIVDEKGRIIEDNAPHGRQVVSPENAFLVCSAMQSVIGDPTGTGRKAQSLGMPLAGKTGTTNDYTDAWFIGFHPDLAVGVWVGHHTKLPIGDRESGPKAALPIWISFMEEMKKTKQLKPGTFVPPPGIVTFQIDELTGKRFPQDCDCDPATKITEFFLQGEGPVDRCRQDEQLLMSEPWFLQKDSFSYDPAKMAFAPAVIRINVEAQKRALHYLDTLMEQGNP